MKIERHCLPEFHENFMYEYRRLCIKYGLMIVPDVITALEIESYDSEIFNAYLEEMRERGFVVIKD